MPAACIAAKLCSVSSAGSSAISEVSIGIITVVVEQSVVDIAFPIHGDTARAESAVRRRGCFQFRNGGWRGVRRFSALYGETKVLL